MSVMISRIGRLFAIKTRTEVFLVTYAVAVGAVERGFHYMEMFPGKLGWVFFILCTGVVFLVGGKLLDSVRPTPALATSSDMKVWPRRRLSRSRPTRSHPAFARSEALRRTD